MARIGDDSWAQGRISRANHKTETKLDLDHTTLISELWSLDGYTQWQYLGIANQKLTKLPQSLAQFKKLRDLNLSNHQLTTLPEWLGELPDLQTLILDNNRVTTLPRTLVHLHVLDLQNNQLTDLPETLEYITQLKVLHLENNQLTILSDMIGNLKQLQTLCLQNNRLTILPNTFRHLNQLRILHLGYNNFISVPESLEQLAQLQELYLDHNQLIDLPASLGQFTDLQRLHLNHNKLTSIPEALGYLSQLKKLYLQSNKLTNIPKNISKLSQLRVLNLGSNNMTAVPETLGLLTQLQELDLSYNQLADLPASLGQLEYLSSLRLDRNPLNPELAAAYEHGVFAVKAYLRAKIEAQVELNEAKLILIGEGEVGKSSLLNALRNGEWIEGRPTTHGIEIKPVHVTDPDSGKEIMLNGWDFGGQQIYRPTHQLFFSAPAVYLVVWKPREGSNQGFVDYWITLIKHRAGEGAKIIVVATHGGPGHRQPDIDQQELHDKFGSETIIDFFHVDSKPDNTGKSKGIQKLKDAIASIAAKLPEMGYLVPEKWQLAKEALQKAKAPYLPYNKVSEICRKYGMDEVQVDLFLKVYHTLGHFIHYHYDPMLHDIVILKPDWLTKAISFVLDDEETRSRHGLVDFEQLSRLWNDPRRGDEEHYPLAVHPMFLKLMERFDLSYRVVLPDKSVTKNEKISESWLLKKIRASIAELFNTKRGAGLNDLCRTILIAQLVPDTRPKCLKNWKDGPDYGEREQIQICHIVDREKGQPAIAEGLFYQLIVRLHKYSLGRENYEESVHWQRGLMLDDSYNGRALLEYIGTDVKITVRAAYPEFYLFELTKEVDWLVEHFWEGLRCDTMVPCTGPCGLGKPGLGLFEVKKLIESKRQGMSKFPCMVSGCNQWLDIDSLLRNSAAENKAMTFSNEEINDVKQTLAKVVQNEFKVKDNRDHKRFKVLTQNQRTIMSRVDQQFSTLLHVFADEAKEGPRLFSFQPVEPGFFERPTWVSAKFCLTLWCEHSRKPLPVLNVKNPKQGVYELTIPKEWLIKAAPYFKFVVATLSLVLPVAVSTAKFALDNTTYNSIQKELDLGQKSLDFSIKSGTKVADWLGQGSASADWEHGEAICAQGALLREMHVLLREKDPGFGGLVRVQNKRREFLWVHPWFVEEY